ncbi:MAG: DUF4097 family beta strand repeat protein [Clostridia bacterium]|nr:DUF4097 family beta strand repeat protein [Clostridia bacterium]
MRKIGLISLLILSLFILTSCDTSINFGFTGVDSDYMYNSYEGFLKIKEEAKNNGYEVVEKEEISKVIPSSVILETVFEDIEIIPYDESEIKVIYTVLYDGKEDPIDFNIDNGKTFKFKVDWNNFTGKAYGVMYIYVPEHYLSDFDIKTVSGDVSSEQIDYDHLMISTTSGDVWVDNSQMDNLDVKTVSGDFKLNQVNVKNFTATTTSGECDFKGDVAHDVRWNTVSGDLYMNVKSYEIGEFYSTSGDIRITCDTLGKSEMDSVSGDIDIRILEKLNATLKYLTVSGDFETKYDLVVNGKNSDYEVNGKYNDGDVELNIETTSGNLTID